MKPKLHALLGTIALLFIGTFWVSTFVSELFLDAASVTAVKHGILSAMWMLIPAMAATEASGFGLSRGRSGRIIEAKKRRMKIIAGNGIVVLLPSAYALAHMAEAGRFDLPFYIVQVVELLAGAMNIALLTLNMRDGRRLSPQPSAARRSVSTTGRRSTSRSPHQPAASASTAPDSAPTSGTQGDGCQANSNT